MRALSFGLAALLLSPMAIAQPPPPPAALMTPAPPGRAEATTPPDFVGVLEETDPRHNGKPYDAFSFEAEAGNEVTVTMTSNQFDTYLIVRSPSGQEWTNDDFGSTNTSQVSFTASMGGSYTIWATAFGESGRGDYEVRVSARSMTTVSIVSGRLDYEDDQLIKGEFYDSFAIEAPSQGEFYVELMPLGFTGFLRVTSPSGARQSTDPYGYYGEQRSIRLGPFQGERGTWTVDVTTAAPDQVGAYDIRVITLD